MQTKKNEHIGNTISCPLSTKDVNIAECQGLNCCLLTLVKEKWKMAGLPIIKDNQIKKKIETLHKVYSSLRESRLGPKVTSFLKDAPKLFDIAHPDLKTIISKDLTRTAQAKEEDISFYMAKIEGKYAKLDHSQDLSYKERVEKKMKRIQKEEELKQKEKERLDKDYSRNINFEDDTGNEAEETIEVDENLDENWSDEPAPKRSRKEKKPDYITINLPRKTLCKLTAPLARR